MRPTDPFAATPRPLPPRATTPPHLAWPLIDQGEELLQHVRALHALPHEAVEHGCGERADVVVQALVELGVPPWIIARGAMMERDMSPAAMRKTNPVARPHALTVPNPLDELADLADPRLEELLTERYGVERQDDALFAGPYRLDPSPRVQFIDARSRVFVVVRLWDPRTGRPLDRVFDPALSPQAPMSLSTLRVLLAAPEALALRAPLGASFRLCPAWLTPAQRELVIDGLSLTALDEVDDARHREVFLALSGAAQGSPGDPGRWTYGNTHEPMAAHGARRRARTDRRGRMRRLERGLGEALATGTNLDAALADLDAITATTQFRQRLEADAAWSERRLIPLVRAVEGMRYLDSLDRLNGKRGRWGQLLEHDDTPRAVEGAAGRLRGRILRLGDVSRDEAGSIDGRCFRPGHIHAVLEAIRQMNEAGMAVAVDEVGNVHGLWPAEAARAQLDRDRLDLSKAVAFVSHLDTVHDAGLYDGRLGVAAGIEAAQLLHDLARFCGYRPGRADRVAVVVSAFANEEMTFTGEGVSMSGSAAVAGLAEPDAIDRMRDDDGRAFRDGLHELLSSVRDAAARRQVDLDHDIAGTSLDELRRGCPPPRRFYCPHSFERHIEQASVLAERRVPAGLTNTIMGLYQADLTVEGMRCGRAALALVARLYALPRDRERLTVGMIRPLSASDEAASPVVERPVLRCVLEGATDHAGAPRMSERRDAVAAAARLVAQVETWATDRRAPFDLGRVAVTPGTNRNVVAGAVELDIAVETAAARADLDRWITGRNGQVATTPVALRVEHHGETTAPSGLRLSLDLRAEHEQSLERLIGEVATASVDHDFSGVQIAIGPVQWHAPTSLARTGQALVLERSYGGSHNPREHERLDDICAGTALQLAVLEDALRGSVAQRSAHALTAYHLPARWTRQSATIVSAASHDTSNLALSRIQPEATADDDASNDGPDEDGAASSAVEQ